MRRLIGSLTIIGLLASACGSTTVAATTVPIATTTTAPTETPTTVPVDTTVAPTPETPTTATAAPGPATFKDRNFPVSYAIIKPEKTVLKQSPDSGEVNYLEHKSGENAGVVLTTRGPSTLDEWRESQVGKPITVSNESTEVEIGGITGAYLTFTAQENSVAPGQLDFTFEPGDSGRVYMVDVGSEVVTIIGVAGPDLWPDFQFELDELIAGLTWD
ncbi:MAG: hypothetical protein JJE47_02840 [Acidimicrobiia bacterium]|nr:hypothetical protein [Acidimicrobiia bacterium]